MSRILLWCTIVGMILPVVGCRHADATVSEESRLLALSLGAPESLTGEHLEVEMLQAEFPDAALLDGKVDVPFELKLKNRSEEPVHISRMNLRSVGEGVYQIEGRTRVFDELIEPGEEKTFTFWSRANVLSGGSTQRPVTLRLVTEYLMGETGYKDTFVERINGRFAIGIEIDG